MHNFRIWLLKVFLILQLEVIVFFQLLNLFFVFHCQEVTPVAIITDILVKAIAQWVLGQVILNVTLATLTVGGNLGTECQEVLEMLWQL